jgi:phenylacetate-CoA ligase
LASIRSNCDGEQAYSIVITREVARISGGALAMPDPTVQSDVPGIRWPAVPGMTKAPVLSLLFQLEQTQWWSREAIRAAQEAQLRLLLRHARATSAFWRERIDAAGVDVDHVVISDLAKLPLLDRTTLQDKFDVMKSDAPPPTHGELSEVRSSGSTGQPVRVVDTELDKLYWDALTIRDSLWHQRDFSAKFAAIRAAIPRASFPHWGAPFNALFVTGPGVVNDVATDTDELLAWVVEEDPAYLLAYPTVLRALLMAARKCGVRPKSLREVSTMGEAMPSDLHEMARRTWNVQVHDIYSARETGYIALQCPEQRHYHVQSESIVAEVLNADGTACEPGETGRVVLTTLHNFAHPLIRYDIGDYAEVGEPCPCGRGLAVLRRIMGRVRNMVVLPDGRRFFPHFEAAEWGVLFGVRQLQLTQKSPRLIEVRVVPFETGRLPAVEPIRDLLREQLKFPVDVDLVAAERIERSAESLKYEDFISEVAC